MEFSVDGFLDHRGGSGSKKVAGNCWKREKATKSNESMETKSWFCLFWYILQIADLLSGWNLKTATIFKYSPYPIEGTSNIEW